MRVLIVDDQYQGKASAVARILRNIGIQDITMVASGRDVLQTLKTKEIDLLILDLQIPSVIGEEIDPDGGVNILKYIEVNSKLVKPTTVIGITAHAESFDKHEKFFQTRGWALMLADQDLEPLRLLLETQCAHLVNRSEQKYDVAVVTALRHTELAAVLRWDCSWEEFSLPGRPEIFHRGFLKLSNGERKSVIAASSHTMGMTSAAILSTVICERFRPRLLIMTGIAAGIRGKAEIGDVLIASTCWDWGSGKLTVDGGKPKFLSSPMQIQLDPTLCTIFTSVAAKREYLDDIFVAWKSKRPSHDLTVRVGPVATGAVVLEDPETLALIQSQHRGTVGVEMEAYGVMAAAHYASEPRPKVVIIKSVCDFADPLKNDEWQEYAAYTSASIAYKLLIDDRLPM